MAQSRANHHEPYMMRDAQSVPHAFSTMVAIPIHAMRSVYRDRIEMVSFECRFMPVLLLLNRLDEEYHLVALLLRELSELLHRFVSIALATLLSATVPHDGLYDVAGTAVVQALSARPALAGQSSTP